MISGALYPFHQNYHIDTDIRKELLGRYTRILKSSPRGSKTSARILQTHVSKHFAHVHGGRASAHKQVERTNIGIRGNLISGPRMKLVPGLVVWCNIDSLGVNAAQIAMRHNCVAQDLFLLWK